jgi:hypothetical protein
MGAKHVNLTPSGPAWPFDSANNNYHSPRDWRYRIRPKSAVSECLKRAFSLCSLTSQRPARFNITSPYRFTHHLITYHSRLEYEIHVLRLYNLKPPYQFLVRDFERQMKVRSIKTKGAPSFLRAALLNARDQIRGARIKPDCMEERPTSTVASPMLDCSNT